MSLKLFVIATLAVSMWLVISGQAMAQVSDFTVAHAGTFDRNSPLTQGTIVAAFGFFQTNVVASADQLPLPTQLDKFSIDLERSTNSGYRLEARAGFFYTSGRQINFLLPDGIQPGLYRAKLNTFGVTNPMYSYFVVSTDGIGLFYDCACGSGAPAGYIERVA